MASRKSTDPIQDDLFNPKVELMLSARLAIEGEALEARGAEPGIGPCERTEPEGRRTILG